MFQRSASGVKSGSAAAGVFSHIGALPGSRWSGVGSHSDSDRRRILRHAPGYFAADSVIQNEPASAGHVAVARFKSRTLQLVRPFASAVVGNPDIADVLPMSERVIYIQGKKVGATNVSVFDKDKNLISVIDLEVTIDIENIKKGCALARRAAASRSPPATTKSS